MAESYGYFDGIFYNAAQFQEFLRAISSQGIASGVLGSLAPSAGPARAVTIASGYAVAGNHWYKSDANIVKSIASNPSATNNRWDLVVVRYNGSIATVGTVLNNTVGIDVLQGVAAASPTEPVPTQTTTLYEVPIARAIPGLSGANTATIVDRRQFGAPPAHDIIAGHSAAGLTAGHALEALTATTFGFRARTNQSAKANALVAQTIPDSTLTTATLGNEVFDYDGMYAGGTGITIVTPGTWLFVAQLEFAANATGIRQGRIIGPSGANIGADSRVANTGGNFTRFPVAGVWPMLAGQQATLEVFQNSGGPLDLTVVNGINPALCAVRLGQ
jgi:hypothetical protein